MPGNKAAEFRRAPGMRAALLQQPEIGSVPKPNTKIDGRRDTRALIALPSMSGEFVSRLTPMGSLIHRVLRHALYQRS